MYFTSDPIGDYRMYRKFDQAVETIEDLMKDAEKGVEIEVPDGTRRSFEDAAELREEVERRRGRLVAQMVGFTTGSIGGPLAVLLLGFVASWVVRGFMQKRTD